MTGGNLADLARNQNLALTDISRIADQIASALDHIHAHGLVHRDIKLENIDVQLKDENLKTVDVKNFKIKNVKVNGKPFSLK